MRLYSEYHEEPCHLFVLFINWYQYVSIFQLPDSQPSTLSSVNSNSLTNLTSYQTSPQSLEITEEDFQRFAAATSGNQEFNVSFYPSDLNSLCSQQQQLLNTISTQQSSPQHQTGHQKQVQQQQPSSPNHLQQQQQQQQQLSPQTSNKIPHIIFTGKHTSKFLCLYMNYISTIDFLNFIFK